MTTELRPGAGVAWVSGIGCLAVAVLVNLPNFVYPFFEDTALFAAVGRWMHAGLVPDRDLIAMKPPAIFWTSYLTYGLFGVSPFGARAVELAVILATADACGRITARFGCAPWGFTALLCALLSSGALWGLPERGQVEFFESAALAWGAYALLEGGCAARVGPLVVSGALLALASWFKPQAALLGGLLAIPLGAVAWYRGGLREAVRLLAAFGLGVASVSALFAGWLWTTGALHPFLDTMLVVNRGYLDLRARPSLLQALAYLRPYELSAGAGIASTALIVAGLATLFRRASSGRRTAWAGIVLGLWLLTAFVQFWSGGYLFNYHKVILVAPAACLIMEGCWALRGLIAARLPPSSGRLRRVIPAAAIATVFVLLGLTPKLLFEGTVLVRWMAGLERRDDVQCHFGKELHYYDYCAQLAAARYVRERTEPGDRVQVIGIGGAFYLTVDRRPATRFLLASLALDPRYRGKAERFAEFMNELRQRPPAYIVARTNDYFPWFGLPSGLQMLQLEPALHDFVRARYVLEGEVSPGFLALRRR
ncbi:MAG TPA: hypothetical protein VML54_17580 [Candidatus Limnocylindrales bacterium]|nr:hypothetical protein [Candidatus Limnocylindrales bacterium]